jgi:hypothetical protein
MPVFYTLIAGLYQVGVPVLAGGRLISLLALVAILCLVWRILFLHTEEKLCAWTGLALAGPEARNRDQHDHHEGASDGVNHRHRAVSGLHRSRGRRTGTAARGWDSRAGF